MKHLNTQILVVYQRYLEQMRKNAESRRTPEWREKMRNKMRRKAHPDWNPSEETFQEYHDRKVAERYNRVLASLIPEGAFSEEVPNPGDGAEYERGQSP